MRCCHCGKEESTYTFNCIIVGHVSDGTEVSELERDRRELGLCDQCQKKLNQTAGEQLMDRKLRGVLYLITLFGLFTAMVGGAWNITTMHLIGAVGVAIVAIGAVGIMTMYLIVMPIKVRKTPWKYFGFAGTNPKKAGKDENYDIYVPYGKGLYKDEEEFLMINNHLEMKNRVEMYQAMVSRDEA